MKVLVHLQEDAVDDAAEKLFLQFAEDTDDIPFAFTKTAEVFTEYKVSEPHVVIFTQVRIVNGDLYYQFLMLLSVGFKSCDFSLE